MRNGHPAPVVVAPRRKIAGPVRFAAPVALATLALFGLFWLLHGLISGGHFVGDKAENLPTIDFVRLNKAFEIETRERAPPKKPDKPEAPPETPTQQVNVQAQAPTDVAIGNMSVENRTNVRAGFGLSASDGEYLPIVKVAPMYPPGAQSRGIEGWVLLEFTVTETGSVEDPKVIEAEPAGTFDEAAKKAVVKFKYKPRVDNGKPVRVPHVQHLITFKIDKNKR